MGRRGLYERERELAQLDDVLARAASGRGGIVVVEAPPGLGKTTLLAEACQRAEQSGMRVLRARAGELETAVPFGVVGQLFAPAVAQADPDQRAVLLSGAAAPAAAALGLEGAAPVPDVFAALNGLHWLTANLAAERPLLLAVDDLHWVDPPSLRFLLHLCRRVDALPVLAVCATRPPPPGEDAGILIGLLQDPATTVVNPDTLSEAASLAVVRDLYDVYAEEAFGRACGEAAGGNPFLLTELVEACRRGAIPPDAEGARRVRELGPRTVARAILVRLGGLGEEARRLARAVAILGAEVPLPRAAALADLSAPDAAAAADALVGASVFRDRRPLEYLHPVIRTAIYDDMPRAHRSAMHRAAAELLAAGGAPADEEAAHLVLTEPAGDADVVDRLLPAAGAALMRGAADGALRLLRRALEEPPPPERRDGVLLELGRAAVVAGAHAEAVEILPPLLERADDPARQAEVAMLVVPAMAYSGRAREGDALTDRLVAALEGEHAELALMLDAHERFSRSDAEQAERLARHRGLPGETPGQRLVLARASHNLALVGEADLEETLSLVRRALPSPDSIVIRSPLEGTCTFEVLWALRLCDRPDLTHPLGAAMADAIRAGGYEYPMVFHLSWAAEVAYREGRIADVADAAERALEIASRYPFGVVPGHRALGFLVLGHLARDAVDDALAAWRDIDVGPNFMGAYGDLRGVEAEVKLAQGDAEGALQTLLEFGDACENCGRRNPAYWPWRARSATWLARLGRAVEATPLLEEGLARARAFGAPVPEGILLRAHGVVADDPQILDEAVRRLEDTPARMELAEALFELGASLRRGNRRADAREPLRASIDFATRCGAEGLARRAHEELAASGGRLRRRHLSGVESLTGSERRIAELAARGVTNREIAQTLFLSVRTVEMHLGNAYRKLDIKSRGELSDALGPGDDAAVSPGSERAAATHAAPDGTVTILFSDIERSAVLVERLGDQRWLELVRRHNAVVREQIAASGGLEVKTIGGAFMVAFRSVDSALSCAVAMQQAFARMAREEPEPLRVRVGLHAGVAVAEDGDFHGRTVMVAARIAAEARGGEILVSSAAREQLNGRVELRFGPVREAQLKDIAEPHPLYPVIW